MREFKYAKDFKLSIISFLILSGFLNNIGSKMIFPKTLLN